MTSPDRTLAADVLALTRALIERPSVSPDDCGCQELLIERLQRVGFEVERMRFGAVDNFWAERTGIPAKVGWRTTAACGVRRPHGCGAAGSAGAMGVTPV